jgi:hypothetical protein
MTTRPFAAAALAGALAVLAACGGEEAAEPTIASDPTVTAPSTTTAPTTAPAATTPPTTAAPTTTVDIDTQLTQALDAYWAGYQRCGEDPANCDLSYLAEQGPIREVSKAGFADLANRGWYLSQDLRGTYFRVDRIDVRGDQASIESCSFDAGIVLGPNGPDGLPTLVNDEELSYQWRHDLFFESDQWKVGRETKLADLGEGDQCAG